MASEPDPRWIREAAGAVAHEFLGWLRALAGVVAAPRRFVAAWADGEIRPLNPLAYSLNTLALAGPATALLVHLAGVEDDVLPLWAQLLKPILPWIYNLLWLLPVHFGLRVLGGKRPLRTTVGASFYVGGPIHLLRIFTVPLQLLQFLHPHDLHLAIASSLCGIAMFLVYTIYMTAAMAGAHRLARWRAALVVVVFFVLSVFFWAGLTLRAGQAGMHIFRAMIT
ncbi:MAG TPA: hypothetical protein VGL86_19395 [Polyangia bacterium]|jgi:hypothetical protein